MRWGAFAAPEGWNATNPQNPKCHRCHVQTRAGTLAGCHCAEQGQVIDAHQLGEGAIEERFELGPRVASPHEGDDRTLSVKWPDRRSNNQAFLAFPGPS